MKTIVNMKKFNVIHAKTFAELEHKIIALIHEAEKENCVTHTVYDGDETGYTAITRVIEKE